MCTEFTLRTRDHVDAPVLSLAELSDERAAGRSFQDASNTDYRLQSLLAVLSLIVHILSEHLLFHSSWRYSMCFHQKHLNGGFRFLRT